LQSIIPALVRARSSAIIFGEIVTVLIALPSSVDSKTAANGRGGPLRGGACPELRGV
jgi:hypothetical protein